MAVNPELAALHSSVKKNLQGVKTLQTHWPTCTRCAKNSDPNVIDHPVQALANDPPTMQATNKCLRQ
jgi:hypothetical protein